MRKKGNKAILKLSPLEMAYQKKFGLLPDYHYERLREKYGDSKDVGEIINKNMYGVWIDYKIFHAIHNKNENTGEFVHADDTPFEDKQQNTVQLLN